MTVSTPVTALAKRKANAKGKKKKDKSILRKAFDFAEYLLPLAELILSGILRRAPNYKTKDMLIEQEREVIEQNLPVVKVLLRQVDTFTNVAGQILKGTVPMDPSSASDWTYLSQLYDEFRVMAIRCHFYPVFDAGSTPNRVAPNFPPLYTCFNNRTTITPSVSTILNYENMTVLGPSHQYGSTHIYEAVRPKTGVDTPIDWIPCASPSGSLGAVAFANNQVITASNSFLEVMTEFALEFRIRS